MQPLATFERIATGPESIEQWFGICRELSETFLPVEASSGGVLLFRYVPLSGLQACDTRCDRDLDLTIYLQALIEEE